MIEIIVNGEKRRIAEGLTLHAFLLQAGIEPEKVAIERNQEIVSRAVYHTITLQKNDVLEVVQFIGGGNNIFTFSDPGLTLAGKAYRSRLIVGTGKYKNFEETKNAVEASGAEIVTVAVRRVNIAETGKPMLIDYLDPKTYVYLPNTAGCYTASDAVRTLRLARESGGWNLVKLEVLGDPKTLYPNMTETILAAHELIKDGFNVMAYCNDDPIACKRLEEAGCVAVMPLGSLIGSGLGVQSPVNIRLIIEQSKIPVIVDAGVGTASDAAIAMELGCDGVLVNTAIAEAKNPILMASAMKHAVISGRQSFLAGRMTKKKYADPSSPLGGLI